MDTIKEILQNLKERFTNPLIFSFLVAWMVFNWQIVVSLLWYDTGQIKAAGFKTIFEFIQNNLKSPNCFCYPLTSALIYTFLLPLIRNLIQAFYSWSAGWGGDWNNRIRKKSTIAFDKYLDLRKAHNNQMNALKVIMEEQEKNALSFSNTQSQLVLKEAENQELKNLNEELKEIITKQNETFVKIYDMSFLNGNWICEFSDTNINLKGYENIFIQNGRYYIINKHRGKEHIFDIIAFTYSSNFESLSFVKRRVNMIKSFEIKSNLDYIEAKDNFNILSVITNDSLKGTENGSVTISYRRL